ncbi:outer membrane protein [Frigidibacter sp. ROC022]|uniref:outer membrane protein n=1 Tax=Frigidibacter sp. ROC022 TaxID=2971796 RepID=UPI00215B2810|nr:porin family protein [Frigidibacter sp. ROC022]MCR8723696.1 porin family protein [Frigidibacter sp. ROC022]
MITRYLGLGATLAPVLLATPLFAGGPGPVVVEEAPVAPVPAAAPITDWSGFYAGLGYAQSTGSLKNGTRTDFNDGDGVSGFAGYNLQNGKFVYGGELSYTGLNDMTLTGTPSTELTDSIDLRARLGYTIGRALPYITVGYSTANLDTATGSVDLDGVNYGLGLDYQVSDRVFLGADYSKRDLSGSGLDADPETLGLRVGFKF